MSNIEFVMVPRELLVRCKQFTFDIRSPQKLRDYIDAELAKPAQKHQGEPVGTLLIDEYFDNREVGEVDVQLDAKVCEQLADKFPGQSLPLYTRADPGEVERLRYKAELYDEVWELATGLGFMNVTTAISTLRAQLAERDALLLGAAKQARMWNDIELLKRIVEVTSASAEPSAPVEIDERAEFELPHYLKLSDPMREAGEHAEKRAIEDGCYSAPVLKAVFFEAAIQYWLDEQDEARAALERKP